MPEHHEHFISVDVETAGPNPGKYALLSIGACTIHEPRETFYIELQPDKTAFTDEALAVSNLPLEHLHKAGTPARVAMTRFADWVEHVTPIQDQPVFTAFNAPFDWMFVNDYFHRYLGYNPFGHKALDIKALYMGLRKTQWSETSYHQIVNECCVDTPLSHHALEDAIQQAKIFQSLLSEIGENQDV
jgi:ribonuclease T